MNTKPHRFLFDATIAPPVAPAGAADPQPRAFSGVAYSGEVIPNHWAWGNLVFDLDTMQLPVKSAALIGHDPNQRAGVVDAFIASHENGLAVSGYLLDNPSGQSVGNEADAGFPWQMSVHIEPSGIDSIGDGNPVTVNGKALAGPLTIFRGGAIREVSFVPVGADGNTSAQVFAYQNGVPITQPEQQFTHHQPTKGDEMTIEELKAQLADTQAQLDAARAETAEIKAQFAAKIAAERAEKFAAVFGAEPTDDERKALTDMSEAQFALLTKKPAAPAHLFSEQATDGAAAAPATPLADFVRNQFSAKK